MCTWARSFHGLSTTPSAQTKGAGRSQAPDRVALIRESPALGRAFVVHRPPRGRHGVHIGCPNTGPLTDRHQPRTGSCLGAGRRAPDSRGRPEPPTGADYDSAAPWLWSAVYAWALGTGKGHVCAQTHVRERAGWALAADCAGGRGEDARVPAGPEHIVWLTWCVTDREVYLGSLERSVWLTAATSWAGTSGRWRSCRHGAHRGGCDVEIEAPAVVPDGA